MDRASLIALFTRRYPFFSGIGRIANSRLMQWAVPPSPEPRWARSRGGHISVTLDDILGRTVFLFGDLDRKLTWILARLIRQGDHVLDVGANIGLVSLWMSDLVGNGTVEAFEPNPVAVAALRKNLAYNRATNVRVHEVALGMQEAMMDLRVPKGDLGGGSLVRHHCGAADVHSVAVRRLDQFDLSVSGRISLIKLDVEGAEFEAIAGAKRTVETCRPIIIFETVHHSSVRTVELLRNWDYGFLSIPRCLLIMKTKRLRDQFYSYDLVAAPRETFENVCRILNAT
jgi:FkbM family methyltransferase